MHVKTLGFPALLTRADIFLTRALKLQSAFTICSVPYVTRSKLLTAPTKASPHKPYSLKLFRQTSKIGAHQSAFITMSTSVRSV